MQEGMNKVLISQQKETLQKLVEKPVMLEGKISGTSVVIQNLGKLSGFRVVF